jgi:hypothetical protein
MSWNRTLAGVLPSVALWIILLDNSLQIPVIRQLVEEYFLPGLIRDELIGEGKNYWWFSQ